MHEPPQSLVVVLEYSPRHARVMVRGVFAPGVPVPAVLHPENTQNLVQVFEGVDMKAHVGFAGLVPESTN